MLGTVLVTEVQKESRPIFRTQPEIRRKKRKAPHKIMITFIHMCSLWTSEKQCLYFERTHENSWNSSSPSGFSTPFILSCHASFTSLLLFLCLLSRQRQQRLQFLTAGSWKKALPRLPGHVPVDAEGVEPVEGQRETHHCHDD